MKADGYHFSLADHACGELINQRSRGSIDDRGFATMIRCLDTFLDPVMPVMLGEKDILAMVDDEVKDNDESDAADISRKAWSVLREQRVQSGNLIEEVLQEDRTSWSQLFQRVNAINAAQGGPADLDEYDHPTLDQVFASFNTHANAVPPPSIRFDLKLRYFWRQFVRSKRERGAYNVNAPKKRNDGIDFGLFSYLALPAFVIATEHRLLAGIADIPSFQANWIQSPSRLVKSWARGDRPRPRWPSNDAKNAASSHEATNVRSKEQHE
jgi:hypothetical protein